MNTWTYEYTSDVNLHPITAVVSADNVFLAVKLLNEELKRLGVMVDYQVKVVDLIPLPTQTRKVRVLSNGRYC